MKTGDDAQTNTDDSEKTAYGKFCQKHGINPNLIMLKVTLFVMYGGKFKYYYKQKGITKAYELLSQ